MSAYTPVKVGVTEEQMDELMAGKTIFLEKSQFDGGVLLPLNKSQAKLIATASRGIKLRLSTRQIKEIQTGEGWLGDAFRKLGKWILPKARSGINFALNAIQKKIPTELLGPLKPVGDAAVGLLRQGADYGLDKLEAKARQMLGGAAGQKALDAVYGEGWFDEYLLPAVTTAAKIAVPIIRGRGTKADYHRAIDEKMGAGWFKDYLLPGVETAAKIAVPLIRGRGLAGGRPPMTGEGWFDALIGGLGQVLGGEATGSGWTPMVEKKRTSAAGLVL